MHRWRAVPDVQKSTHTAVRMLHGHQGNLWQPCQHGGEVRACMLRRA